MAAAKYPHEQAKIQAEIDAVVGPDRGVSTTPVVVVQRRIDCHEQYLTSTM